jgi:hypothetical protein
MVVCNGGGDEACIINREEIRGIVNKFVAIAAGFVVVPAASAAIFGYV